jgi:hypothetical protein
MLKKKANFIPNNEIYSCKFKSSRLFLALTGNGKYIIIWNFCFEIGYLQKLWPGY